MLGAQNRPMIAWASAWLCLALAAPVGLGSAKPSSQEAIGRGLLVISVDAWRADHLPGFGYDRETMPALTKWIAEEGVSFRNVWSAGPGVIPAHVALLTGCDPTVARQPPLPLEDGSVAAPLLNWLIPRSVPRLAEEFLARGWLTGGFVDHATLAGLRGFRQGFRDYYDFGDLGDGEDRLTGFEGVALRFVDWIKDIEREQDWFAYLHMNDLERLWTSGLDDSQRRFAPRQAPVDVPPRAEGEPVFFAVPRSRVGAGRYSYSEYEAIYDSALFQLDRKLQRLFGRLKSTGHWEDTTIVLVGSYGLGFGEGGLIVDSGTLSPVDLHIPLLIRPAPRLGLDAGLSFDTLASSVDVAPTLLELFGYPVRAGMHGRSLAPLFSEPLRAVHPLIERPYQFASHGIYGGFAVTDGEFLLQVAEPGSRGVGLLSISWFGDDRGHRGEFRELLYDLSKRTKVGRMEWGVEDPERKALLSSAGREWLDWMARLQRALHHTSLGRVEADPAELAALRERGLIGPQE